MNLHRLLRVSRIFAALAGGGDLLTGLGLVAVPALTLAAMGVRVPGAEALVFVRFVGAFVGAVGASYWLALAHGSPERLRAVFRLTILFRLAAGGYVAAAVGTGTLEWPWLSVTTTDFILAGGQAWLLRQFPPAHD